MMINQAPTENVETEQELLTVENQYWAELNAALERLENGNPQPDDFKKVILEGYFKDRAINGVSMMDAPGVADSGQRKDLVEEMISISKLQWYFNMIKNLGTSETLDEEE